MGLVNDPKAEELKSIFEEPSQEDYKQYVFCKEGKWYHWDYTLTSEVGPFNSEDKARKAYHAYCVYLDMLAIDTEVRVRINFYKETGKWNFEAIKVVVVSDKSNPYMLYNEVISRIRRMRKSGSLHPDQYALVEPLIEDVNISRLFLPEKVDEPPLDSKEILLNKINNHECVKGRPFTIKKD